MNPNIAHPLNLAEQAETKLEALIEFFGTLFFPGWKPIAGCRCDLCSLDRKISRLHRILEMAACAEQPEQAVA